MQKLLCDFDFDVAVFDLGSLDASTMVKTAFIQRIGTDFFMHSMVVIIFINAKSENKLEIDSDHSISKYYSKKVSCTP